MIFLDGMVPLFNAALNKRVVAKLRKRPLTKKASKSGMSAEPTLTKEILAFTRQFMSDDRNEPLLHVHCAAASERRLHVNKREQYGCL